jgi:hypothetical protein
MMWIVDHWCCRNPNHMLIYVGRKMLVSHGSHPVCTLLCPGTVMPLRLWLQTPAPTLYSVTKTHIMGQLSMAKGV